MEWLKYGVPYQYIICNLLVLYLIMSAHFKINNCPCTTIDYYGNRTSLITYGIIDGSFFVLRLMGGTCRVLFITGDPGGATNELR